MKKINKTNIKSKTNIKINKYLKYKIFNLYIKTTLNNTFVTLTNIKGKIKSNCSGGKFKNIKKSTAYAAENAISKVLKDCLNFGVKKIQLFINGIGKSKKTTIKIIKSFGIKILIIENITPVPYNGCRKPRKPR